MRFTGISKRIQDIRGLCAGREDAPALLTPLEQLVLFGEVSNEIVDLKGDDAEKHDKI
ncbi:MAG: hypothetical protein JW724_07920 [Candidatus Altiarchaeota archaeon]|nr:hypothetical protein [Candidatus Altiarchaeota archaeon]